MVRASILAVEGLRREKQEYAPAKAHEAGIARTTRTVIGNRAPQFGAERRGHADVGGAVMSSRAPVRMACSRLGLNGSWFGFICCFFVGPFILAVGT